MTTPIARLLTPVGCRSLLKAKTLTFSEMMMSTPSNFCTNESFPGTLVAMTTLELPRNVQFLYEEHLARLEFEALGCHELSRAGDHWDQMTAAVNGMADVMLSRSAYLG